MRWVSLDRIFAYINIAHAAIGIDLFLWNRRIYSEFLFKVCFKFKLTEKLEIHENAGRGKTEGFDGKTGEDNEGCKSPKCDFFFRIPLVISNLLSKMF